MWTRDSFLCCYFFSGVRREKEWLVGCPDLLMMIEDDDGNAWVWNETDGQNDLSGREISSGCLLPPFATPATWTSVVCPLARLIYGFFFFSRFSWPPLAMYSSRVVKLRGVLRSGYFDECCPQGNQKDGRSATYLGRQNGAQRRTTDRKDQTEDSLKAPFDKHVTLSP